MIFLIFFYDWFCLFCFLIFIYVSSIGVDSFLVFGAGAWGTALAIQLSRSKQKVVLTSFDKNNLLEIFMVINLILLSVLS